MPLLGSLPRPLGAEASPPPLPTLTWLWLKGDWARLHQLIGRCFNPTAVSVTTVPPAPRPGQPGGITGTGTKGLGFQPSCHCLTGRLGRALASGLLGSRSLLAQF